MCSEKNKEFNNKIWSLWNDHNYTSRRLAKEFKKSLGKIQKILKKKSIEKNNEDLEFRNGFSVLVFVKLRGE